MKKANLAIIGMATALMLIGVWWPSFSWSQQNDLILKNSSYVVTFDIVNRVPRDVVWVLRPSDFSVNRSRVAKYFKADSRTPKPRVKDSDYRNSGFMRGHMCPAGDRTATKSMMKETFLMSNVAPMSGRLNCGRWSYLEAATRRLAAKYDSVRVRVGTLYLDDDTVLIGGGRIRVPSHFFREVRTARGDSLLLWEIVSQ